MNNRIYQSFLFLPIIFFLSSCQTLLLDDQPKISLAEKELSKSQELNSDSNKVPQITTEQALASLIKEDEHELKITEERFDISVQDVEIKSFLLGLVDSTPYNIIVSPDLDFVISLQLKNVTVSDILYTLTQIYPIVIEKNADLYLASSAETMTAIYNIDYLNIRRSGDSKTSVAGQSISGSQSSNDQQGNTNQTSNSQSGSASIQQSNSSNVETKTETDFWKELTESLNLIIKNEEKANIVVSPHAGLVVVRALPKTQELIKRYLSSTQKSLDRQVIIEAKIIEVRLNEGFQAGVDWSKIGNTSGDVFTIGQQGQVIRQQTSDTPINGIFSLLYQGNSFNAAIDLLKSQGDVQVLSSPRVSTINNQKAIIKVGSDEFFVTDVSTTTVTGTSTSTTPDVTLTPFFSGISLDLTPQVNSHGDIVLHIHPIVSEVIDQSKTLSLGQDQFTLPLALTNVRESDSLVRTRDGRVVVIGGLMQNTISEEYTSTPVLGDIPLVGNLFKQTRQSQIKSELVILLRAKLVDPQRSNSQLEDIRSRFSQF